ncbi:MAG: class I SAM-dependent methyltransferase, partial [Flavobacteriaceae bacterium]|nr:class I SAM-dependent methyltransferase [Flavobacteriaceae bacterium]
QLEQTSSEKTAAYKASLLKGNRVADLSGGFGVDSYFFSREVPHVTYCEIDPELHEITSQNAKALGIDNVDYRCTDGIAFLSKTATEFDYIYLDPSRRDQDKKKVFQLSDCSPDVILNLELLLNKAGVVIIKTSPLLDLSAGIEQLQEVTEIHVVAVENEVKELLWVLRKERLKDEVEIKAVNLTKQGQQLFKFDQSEEQTASCSFSNPLTYLYEPNSAILKAGAFKAICAAYAVKKLHEHSHLYTADSLLTFPGRVFKIEEILPYNNKALKKFKGSKANVSIRNFPESVARIRKRFQIKDGGKLYLFFTINKDDQRIVIQCTKDIPS